jgi:LAO/AO transport system kinase
MTLLDRGEADSLRFLDELGGGEASPRRVVVTGPPGVGKSCLLRGLLACLRDRGERACVLACDPQSPTSSGVFFGDRLRWAELAADRRFFLRSLAHRPDEPLLSPSALRCAAAAAAAGFPWIFVETVGSGQSQLPRGGPPSVIVLVLSPACGDEVQMLKAGVIEAADLIVVNKVEQPGGDAWARQLEETLHLGGTTAARVLRAEATAGKGVREILEAVESVDRSKERRVSAPRT